MPGFSQMELNRMGWRCRRGMAELDLLLVPFFENAFADLAESQQHTFISLLDEEDPVLWEWFSERTEPPGPATQALVQFMLNRVRP